MNWGEVDEGRPHWSLPSGRLYAIWPSPVDQDLCFDAAGFADFGDSDAVWHRDFADLVARVLESLAQLGTAILREGEYPVDRGCTRVSCRDALIAAATDDNFPPCVVGFGDPLKASVRTSDGHALLWTWLSEGVSMDAVVTRLASDHETKHMTMQWEKLA
ncbi:MAG TPA: hypothetical protein VLT62_20940 [Candidatus Methylomirabilis sp.]|nr:hypothetical protein [Candidatus Methylomirabilis sp.]